MAELTTFSIAPGETVTAFAVGPLEQTHYPGKVRPGVDNVDYVFVNGFVDVGDLPCRTALLADIANRDAPSLTAFETTELVLPGLNRRLDFSGFWHVPTRLKRWVRTRLFPEISGVAPFEIATCGGVHIWVDGVRIDRFEPYQRNTAHMKDVALPLRAEGSDVVILLEDLAERDTNFWLELTWRGDTTLMQGVQTIADPAAIKTLMQLAREVRPTQVVFDGTAPLSLTFDCPTSRDVQIEAHIRQSVHLSHKPPLFSTTVSLATGSTEVVLGDMDGLADAYHPLSLTFSVGEAQVERGIGFALLRQSGPVPFDGDLETRKAHALQHAALHGEPRMGRVLALLATKQPLDDSAVAALIDSLEGIEARRDCSDFVMVPLLWAFGAYADRFPPALADRTRNAILNYRYWVDEPGNDTMWFWSENHVLCFHVSEYIAGGLFPDEVFPNAGLTGREHRNLAKQRMSRWYDSIDAHGLAEWNSAAYYPIDFIGLFAMHHWAEGPMKTRATLILDRLFTMLALHTSGGVAAGTMGRAYDKELRAGPLSELAPFAAVAFGTGWLNDGVAALPQFCISNYAPPKSLAPLADPVPTTAINARYVQGYGAAARLALYKTAHVQMSASVDAPSGSTGHQQHLLDIQMTAAPFARMWINHPGEDDPWGSNRPSYWAGNGVMPCVAMHENRALFLSTLGAAARLNFTHVYAPVSEFDDVCCGADWMVLRSGAGVIILKATGEIRHVSHGPGAGLEHRLEGQSTGWAVISGDCLDELDPICQRAKDMRLTLGPDGLTLFDPLAAPLRLNGTAGLFVDGQAFPFPTQSHSPQISSPVTAPLLSEKR